MFNKRKIQFLLENIENIEKKNAGRQNSKKNNIITSFSPNFKTSSTFE